MTAAAVGLIGVALSLGIGVSILGLDPVDCARSVAASFGVGLVSLLATLWAERVPFIKRFFLHRSLLTWALLSTLYFGGLLALAPALRDGRAFAWLVVPMLMCTGWTILAFGPIQDRLVARAQRRQREKLARFAVPGGRGVDERQSVEA